MKKITFLLMLFFTASIFAQTNLEDFESIPADPATGYGGFGGLATGLVADPTDGSNQVGEMVTNTGANVWQGANVFMQENFLQLTTNKVVTIRVYSNGAFNMIAKADGGQSSAPASQVVASHTGSGWETLSFDFANGFPAAANGEYGVLALFPNSTAVNDNTFNNPITAVTAYIDDVMGVQGASIAPDPVPMTAAPASTPPAGATTFGIYGDQGNVSLDELPTAWSQGAFSEETIAGNATWKFDGEFLGMVTNYASGIDLSGMQSLVINYWTESDRNLLIKLVNTIDSTEELINLPTTVGDGSWQTVTVDLAAAAGRANPTTRAAITQILIDPIDGPGLFYIDNFYFHNMSLSTNDVTFDEISVFPNPSNSIWNVKTGSQNITSINVFDVLGKQVISLTPNTNEASIDASELNNGIYLAKVSTANGTKTMKLVKN